MRKLSAVIIQIIKEQRILSVR